MESKVKLLGHPVHPMLIPVPLGLFIAAVVFDAVHFWRGSATMAVVAYWNIAGRIVGGLLAAGVGLIDWLPLSPSSPAKRDGVVRWGADGPLGVGCARAGGVGRR